MNEGLVFDYKLGYARDNGETAGFEVIGDGGAPDGTIVTLGGYTTLSQAREGVSWVNYLFQMFDGKTRIINGDTDGYTSAQELTSLIRDVIPFNPKLVITLSGFYNFAYKHGFVTDKKYADIVSRYPFSNPLQLEFFKEITSHFGLGNDGMYYGEESDMPAWAYWLEHMKIMNAVCSAFGMNFHAFLQPCVFSGGYNRGERENQMLMRLYQISADELEAAAEKIRREYEQAIMRMPDFITDISSIFTNDRDVYVDASHVRNNAVHRIAEVILNHT